MPTACPWCTREPAWLAGRTIASSASATIAGIPWDRVNDLLEDRSGTLWLGIHDGGLMRVRDGHVTHLTKKDGLADDSVYVALRRSCGTVVWVGTLRNGVSADLRTDG